MKYQIQISGNRNHPRKNLTDKKKSWLIEVASRRDLTYINSSWPGNVFCEGQQRLDVFAKSEFTIVIMRLARKN